MLHQRVVQSNLSCLISMQLSRQKLPGRVAARARYQWVVLALLVVHVGALGFQAIADSPAWDEVGHFAAGLEHWHRGRFRFYCVNPPLVRLLAMAPVAINSRDLDPYEDTA